MIRIADAETADDGGPGFRLDVYAVASAFRCEARDPNENIVFAITTAKLEGDGGAFESTRSYFAANGMDHVGAALVVEAQAELKASGWGQLGPAVPGHEVARVVLRAIEVLREAHPDVGQGELEHVAAAAAVALKRSFRITERTGT